MLRNKRGFTVLEAMIALVILSMALLALLRVMPVGIKGSKLAEQTTIATMLAQKKIEETREKTWPLAGGSGNFADDGYPNFDYVLEITSATPTTYLREVTVTVSWPAGVTPQRTVALQTHIANY